MPECKSFSAVACLVNLQSLGNTASSQNSCFYLQLKEASWDFWLGAILAGYLERKLTRSWKLSIPIDLIIILSTIHKVLMNIFQWILNKYIRNNFQLYVQLKISFYILLDAMPILFHLSLFWRSLQKHSFYSEELG